MAEDTKSKILQLISPTEEQAEKYKKTHDLGQNMMRILRDEGYINHYLRILSEKALQDGVPPEKIK